MCRTVQKCLNHFVPCALPSIARRPSLVSLFQRAFPLTRLWADADKSRRGVMQWTSSPKVFHPSNSNLVDPSSEIEEETLPTYDAAKYYPARQGEVFNERYQVLAKLGYGVTSTVWFARDLV